ncbi:hypothetical protein [Mycolicibacterium peregrinum]|uniref:hypothetical protein n=1 Tax=Mycolicibacterium peregrinum TaxID=43304 RepID=UPI0007E9E5C0|nr:hypothetical protein [Mycolicibacterium peregrinum]OBF41351.1 hypothetical protein A5719_13830 [Mycolicibacterium peregrinum]
MRAQLDVLAKSAEQAVIWAGGLICDRALGGWAVVVWLPETVGTPALKILGAETRIGVLDAEFADTGTTLVRVGHSLSSAAERPRHQTYRCVPPVSHSSPHDGSGRQVSSDDALQHRLSMAARAFKEQALRACGSLASAGFTEHFRPAEQRWSPRQADTATPAG